MWFFREPPRHRNARKRRGVGRPNFDFHTANYGSGRKSASHQYVASPSSTPPSVARPWKPGRPQPAPRGRVVAAGRRACDARRPRAAVEFLEGRVGLGALQLLGRELEAAVVRFDDAAQASLARRASPWPTWSRSSASRGRRTTRARRRAARGDQCRALAPRRRLARLLHVCSPDAVCLGRAPRVVRLTLTCLPWARPCAAPGGWRHAAVSCDGFALRELARCAGASSEAVRRSHGRPQVVGPRRHGPSVVAVGAGAGAGGPRWGPWRTATRWDLAGGWLARRSRRTWP